jgi:hypothetical protein
MRYNFLSTLVILTACSHPLQQNIFNYSTPGSQRLTDEKTDYSTYMDCTLKRLERGTKKVGKIIRE